MKNSFYEQFLKCFAQDKHDPSDTIKLSDITDGKPVIYGAGYAGLMFLELLLKQGITPCAVLDASPAKQGKEFLGVEIKKPCEDIIRGKTVIVCLLRRDNLYEQIKNEMLRLGCGTVYHLYALRGDRELFREQPLIISPDRGSIRENREKLFEVYGMLGDELSRETLSSIIQFLCADTECKIPALPISEQYFTPLYTQLDNEVFVDVGAHTGETLEQFFAHRACGFKEYYAFEPDAENITIMKNSFADRLSSSVHFENKALGNFNGEVKVRNYLGSNSRICNDGEQAVQCVRLDEYPGTIFPTHIKIDAEGMDKDILLGGKQMLLKDRPVITVAVYHKESDFWEIPLLLKEWFPDYLFYLRSYMNAAETVLYALPPERSVTEEKR